MDAHHAFWCISLPPLLDYTMWNFLISSFVEYVNIRKGQFSERMLKLFAFTELIWMFTLRKILPVRRVTLPAKPTFGISSKTVRTSFVRKCRKSCLARSGELDTGRRVTLLPGASRIQGKKKCVLGKKRKTSCLIDNRVHRRHHGKL